MLKLCLQLVIAKKKWCILFAYRPLNTNKSISLLSIIYTTLNKVWLAGDLNIDKFKTGSESSNHLCCVKDVFNLANLVKPTCLKSQDGNLIGLMLANRSRSFLKFQNFEISITDCAKLVVSLSLFHKTSEKNHNL